MCQGNTVCSRAPAIQTKAGPCDQENNENREAFVLLFCSKFWSKVKLMSALCLLKDRVVRFSKTFFFMFQMGAQVNSDFNIGRKQTKIFFPLQEPSFVIFSPFSYSYFLS